MKWIFKISLTLNFLMVGCLVYWGGHLRIQSRITNPPEMHSEQKIDESSRGNPKAVMLGSLPQQIFDWSQLESSNDYRIYVANLRAIGCPEATVKDIVCGDTARAFTCKRRELGLNGDGSGAWSFQRQKILVAELLGEPGQMNYSIGKSVKKTIMTGQSDASENVASHVSSQSTDSVADQSAAGATVSASTVAISSGRASLASSSLTSRAVVSPVYPLVMQTVNLDALALTAAQKTAVQTLQQQFINAVGGLDQNPNDPVYLKRWQLAQPQSDFLLKAMLGITAWENYQLLAADSATPTPDPYAALNQ